MTQAVEYIGFKQMRRAYGFDEVALVPGDITINPDQVDIAFHLGPYTFAIPVLAAAMDAVVDVSMAARVHQLGGLAVLNLEGVQARYDHPEAVLAEIAAAPDHEATALLQRIYSEPIKEYLIAERIQAIKRTGAVAAVSVTPANTKRYAPVTKEAGVDILVIQSTVTSARHKSKSQRGLIISDLCQQMGDIPVVVGNTASYGPTLELMHEGVAGVLVGVGPGAACTSREVLGIGVPQVTATIDAAAARDQYYRQTGRYVAIITDGGIRTGGDLCKSIASGADAVMLATAFAQAKESPGFGYNWGMATPNPALPRGTRIKVGVKADLHQILFGPTSLTDGTQNLMGALRVGMGMCGASTIQEMHDVELIVAPAIKTEGKMYQMIQALG
ncbi:MAG: GuaB3 family IMP dehydrogenase-related protein [Chloroflexi bacterium]|nr:GuaB3 family IMP dehydrogenase-related protein [Chloroflexota bacterium]